MPWEADVRRQPPEEDLHAVAAIAAIEPHERPIAPTNLEHFLVAPGQLKLEAWLRYLDSVRLIELVPGKRYASVVVPAWVNDLVGVLDFALPSKPAVEQARPERQVGSRAVKRAVRSAVRSPLFRARLAAEAARLRVEIGVTFGCHAKLRDWLLTRDWSDTRPLEGATADGAPKT